MRGLFIFDCQVAGIEMVGMFREDFPIHSFCAWLVDKPVGNPSVPGNKAWAGGLHKK